MGTFTQGDVGSRTLIKGPRSVPGSKMSTVVLCGHVSGADNGTNRANCDTSTKFGTNVRWGLLVKSARWATSKSKMAAIFPR